jgi:hypothetical protein
MTYVAYFIWGVCAISALMFCCLRKTLRLAVAIVKTAGLFLRDVKSVLVVPICTQMFALIIFAIWLVGFIYIYSSGTVTG